MIWEFFADPSRHANGQPTSHVNHVNGPKCLGSRPDSRSRSKAVSLWRAFNIRDYEGCRSFSTLSLVQMLVQNGSEIKLCMSQLVSGRSCTACESVSPSRNWLNSWQPRDSEAKFTKKLKRRKTPHTQEPRSKIFLPQALSITPTFWGLDFPPPLKSFLKWFWGGLERSPLEIISPT